MQLTTPVRTQATASGRPYLHRLLDLVYGWQQRALERHHLASLSDQALRDVGLSRADVEFEASKPFWRG